MAVRVSQSAILDQVFARVSEKPSRKGLAKAACADILSAYADVVREELAKDNSVSVLGFGTFKPAVSKARDAFNPTTMEPIHVPEKKVVRFRMSGAYKAELNK